MTRTHEIKLDGYGAHTTLAEDRPIMLLGTAESYGIETLHVVPGESWEGLTVTATFNAPDGTSTDMLMSADGSITVPSEATAKSGSGKIVFTGVSEGVQRISCDLEYFVVAHSSINGAQSGGTAPSWFEQAATRFMPPGGTTGQVLTKLTNTDFDAGWQDSQGGAGLAPLIGTTQTITPSQVLAAIKAGRDVALQYTDSNYGAIVFGSFIAYERGGAVVSSSIIPQLDGVTGALLGLVEDEGWNFNATNTVTKDDVGTAVSEALTAAKASGEFDGADGQDGVTPTIGDNGNWYLGAADTGKPSRGDKGADGKSAYQYAQDGGYTGTETEFAAKLAQEKFASPNALTFTGAVEGSYDGSKPVTVEIPGEGGNKGWTLLYDGTITIEEAVKTVTVSLLAPCEGMVDFIGHISWTANANTESGMDDISIGVGKASMGYGRIGKASKDGNSIFQATVTSSRTYWGGAYSNPRLEFNKANMMYGFSKNINNANYENATIDFFAKTYAGTITLQLYGR